MKTKDSRRSFLSRPGSGTTTLHVGDAVVVHAMGRFRQGIIVALGRVNAHVEWESPSTKNRHQASRKFTQCEPVIGKDALGAMDRLRARLGEGYEPNGVRT
jgi:hypothetical protein